MSTASFKAAQIIKCINAGISCIASAFIMFMILTEPEKGLASPYSRIIFALSISDIFFSLGMLLSPFMGPKDNPDALFAIGTTESCEAIGFIFIIGLALMVLYTVFLTYYFMRRIKYKVTPQTFAKKEEKYFHVIFIVFAVTVAFIGVSNGSINPQGKGNICGIGPYPVGCDKSPDMICERGDGKLLFALSTVVMVVGGFLLIIVILAMFTHHVYTEERTLTIPAREIGKVHRRRESNEVDDEQREENADEMEENNANAGAVAEASEERNKMILTKQALHQSLLYILAFFFSWLPPIILLIQINFLDIVEEQEWRFWLGAILTPLTGVFNILIYTRPKVLKLKESFPDGSYIDLLTVIVVSGGEIPSMADLLQATTINRHQFDGQEVPQQGEVFEEEELFEDGRVDELSAEANSYASSNSLLSYDVDVSSAYELLSLKYESGKSLFSVIRQR
ncbi:hypothetical protein CTEN210_01045 [Chaetoceros tenuissimus]|uniref:G-protein coupled receptors family 1 profile domain-containing protein n=1 Tax=Chaetoceros tenuissimus TaxID=426638 RepID=A0AAD3CGU9_9STRA|nr:hypothetical protein CTEN210_01045 [Chaetoceros tenuissimus]